MDERKILAIKDFLLAAEKSIQSAKKILATIVDSKELKK
jgi:hypothetical protein